MDKLNIFEENRPWGKFRQFTLNTQSTIKIISVKPNEILSLQSHKYREEFWKVLKGNGIFEINEIPHAVSVGNEYYVRAGEKHRITGGENGIEILEISFGDFEENDIIRYEDKYGRA